MKSYISRFEIFNEMIVYLNFDPQNEGVSHSF